MKPPQLRMIRRGAEAPERSQLKEGYTIRRATVADDVELDALLSAAFGDGWNPGSVGEVLLNHPEVPTTWVIEFGGKIVATASYQLKPQEFPETGWVHYVAADSDHAGNRLGYAIVWVVVDQALSAGHTSIFLTTDDFRLPAIQTYLNLGFEPDPWHETHEARWEAVLKLVSQPRIKKE